MLEKWHRWIKWHRFWRIWEALQQHRSSTGIHICDISLPEPEGQIKHDSLMKVIEKKRKYIALQCCMYLLVNMKNNSTWIRNPPFSD